MWVLVVVVFIQVVLRYLFRYSLPWSEETARFLFLWIVWIGAAYAVKMRAHLKIDFVVNMLPQRAQKYMELFATLIWFAFCLFFTYKGVELTRILFVRGQITPVMKLPMAYVYAAVPTGAILMLLRLVEDLARQIRDLREERRVKA